MGHSGTFSFCFVCLSREQCRGHSLEKQGENHSLEKPFPLLLGLHGYNPTDFHRGSSHSVPEGSRDLQLR